jgi:hypothetical protein
MLRLAITTLLVAASVSTASAQLRPNHNFERLNTACENSTMKFSCAPRLTELQEAWLAYRDARDSKRQAAELVYWDQMGRFMEDFPKIWNATYND